MIEGDKRKGIQSSDSKMFNGIIAERGACGIVIGYDKTFQKYNLSYVMITITLINGGTIKAV